MENAVRARLCVIQEPPGRLRHVAPGSADKLDQDQVVATFCYRPSFRYVWFLVCVCIFLNSKYMCFCIFLFVVLNAILSICVFLCVHVCQCVQVCCCVAGIAVMGEQRAGWALDDVYIGGHEVNSFHLDDDLETANLPSNNIGNFKLENKPNGLKNDLNEIKKMI